jgi:hypothetical protein
MSIAVRAESGRQKGVKKGSEMTNGMLSWAKGQFLLWNLEFGQFIYFSGFGPIPMTLRWPMGQSTQSPVGERPSPVAATSVRPNAHPFSVAVLRRVDGLTGCLSTLYPAAPEDGRTPFDFSPLRGPNVPKRPKILAVIRFRAAKRTKVRAPMLAENLRSQRGSRVMQCRERSAVPPCRAGSTNRKSQI